MTDDREFPTAYRDVLVTFEKPICGVNQEGSQWMDRLRCVEVQEGDEHFLLMQPNVSNDRDNDVFQVRKDNVRGVLYMGDTGND